MQADEIGVDLLAHAHEGLHEGGSDLAAEQAAGLEQRADRQDVGGAHRSNGENDDRGQRERLADRLQDLGGKKIVGRPVLREAGPHETGDADQNRAERQRQTRVDTLQKPAERKDDQELRQGDPEQNGADLQLAIVLHHLKVGRNDVGGRENDEAEAGDQEQDRHKPLSGEQPKIEERLLRPQLPHDEGEREQAAGQARGR